MSNAKSAFEKVLAGTLRKDRESPKHTTDAGYRFPDCPKHLQGEPRRIWSQVKREMNQYGLITGADAPILEQYCYLLSKLRANHDEFSASLHGQLRGISSDLYLTPESRTKLKLEKPNPDELILERYGV
jgi:phage terminase small subunit